MATPQERLIEALTFLKDIQDKGITGIHTDDIPNIKYRKLLLKKGFMKEVSKGWYIATDPNERDGETTSWYSSYWDFIVQFLNRKYGDNWNLSADQSLLIHAGNWTVPQQLIIRTSQGNNNPTPLPHNTSILNLKTETQPSEQIEVQKGVRLYNLQSALIYCSAPIYSHNPIETRTVLSLISDASELLPILLENGHTTLAGRLAGAFRNIGRKKIADQIVETFKDADYDIREEDPFTSKLTIQLPTRERSPYANRIRLMWMEMREAVIANFPVSPGLITDYKSYLNNIDHIFVTDAYHSLSIERYKVTPELIAEISSGEWNIKENEEDRRHRDAMAARGYFQAFNEVKNTIENILKGANSGIQVELDLAKWHRQLFDPSVSAGILQTSDLAGYRNHQVYISNSKHVPLNVDAMRDTMPILFELLEEESEASVRAVLGHFIFVFIHPYMDGNGRIGRFLMNAMLASGGYPWTVIPVERREEYMQALESASVYQDIVPFSRFLGYLVEEGLKGKAVAELPK
ncbi:Fic family protein [Flavobacterium sp. WV_118_3]|uniref:Fic family protein n=1 Tax=Flavobacterium sp. WV_118_3 TaxID=3151764 RepID=UPI003218E422